MWKAMSRRAVSPQKPGALPLPYAISRLHAWSRAAAEFISQQEQRHVPGLQLELRCDAQRD
ncbi:MAG TPA: hypothetical protein VMS65_04850, partial [Polyangiaceae bacterium]|nr:hypothetical protein [Polyangiaceae bacterium]